MSEQVKEVHWNDVIGRPIRHNLHPKMLTTEGYKLRLRTHLKGDKRTDPHVTVELLLDKEYVKAFLMQNVWEKLGYTPQVGLQKLAELYQVELTTNDNKAEQEKISAKDAVKSILDRQPNKTTIQLRK